MSSLPRIRTTSTCRLGHRSDPPLTLISISVFYPVLPYRGCTFIDTADMYGSGHNEELLGPFVQKHRDQVFLCTKFALIRGPGGSFEGVRGDPAYVKEACDASLKRLGIDQIDLYCQSNPRCYLRPSSEIVLTSLPTC